VADATTSDLPAFPMIRTCPFEPPPPYAKLRAEEPVSRATMPDGSNVWLIANYELSRKLLSDPRISSNRADPGFPHMGVEQPKQQSQGKGYLTWMDPPVHTTYRHMLTNEFTVRRIQALRPRVQEIADQCITQMLEHGAPADLVDIIAIPLPALSICELLGVPYGDREVFRKRTTMFISHTNSPAERIGSRDELRAYLSELVRDKNRQPSDDLMSRLIAKYHEAGLYDEEHLAGLAMQILIAGHETTANMISLSVLALLEDPKQLAELVAEPGRMPAAVEELLRFFSIADRTTSRVAMEDIEIGGVVIKAGEGVVALNGSANRDDQVFADPDTMDLHRDARHHMAFGHGIHQCLGQNLARLELDVLLTTLFQRIPTLRLAEPVDALKFKTDRIVYGLYEMPVAW